MFFHWVCPSPAGISVQVLGAFGQEIALYLACKRDDFPASQGTAQGIGLGLLLSSYSSLVLVTGFFRR